MRAIRVSADSDDGWPTAADVNVGTGGIIVAVVVVAVVARTGARTWGRCCCCCFLCFFCWR